MRQTALLLLLALTTSLGCSTTNYPPAPIAATGTLTSPSPPSTTPDVIEFRVLGDIGASTAAIRFSDPINGVTVLSSASLPYLARVSSTETSAFLSVSASATPMVAMPYSTPAVLQCQIAVNGVVFREDYAIGYTALSVSASGTWHR